MSKRLPKLSVHPRTPEGENIATVLSWEPMRGHPDSVTVVVACPNNCKNGKHQHGGYTELIGTGQMHGFRVAHCDSTGNKGYYIGPIAASTCD